VTKAGLHYFGILLFRGSILFIPVSSFFAVSVSHTF
jgi:hypothetical protein